MPTKSEMPRFRVHTKRGSRGQEWTSYFYDMRGTGRRDVALGNDYARAVEAWRVLHNGGQVRAAPPKTSRVIPPRQPSAANGSVKGWRQSVSGSRSGMPSARSASARISAMRQRAAAARWWRMLLRWCMLQSLEKLAN